MLVRPPDFVPAPQLYLRAALCHAREAYTLEPPIARRIRRKPAVGGGTIASALSEARASLKDPSRPFTPHALRRDRSLGAAAPVRGLPADPPADAAAPPTAPPAAPPDEDPRQAAEDRALRAAARCLAKRGRARDSSAACDVLQRALAPWFGTGTFNSRDSVGRRAVLAALAAALAHDDAGTRLAVSRGNDEAPGRVAGPARRRRNHARRVPRRVRRVAVARPRRVVLRREGRARTRAVRGARRGRAAGRI